MPQHVVRVDGVNMDATILDVQDLATLRGGSLALLDAPRRAERVLKALEADGTIAAVSRVQTGASEGVFTAETADPDAIAAPLAAALAGEAAPGCEAEPVYRHLAVLSCVEPVDEATGGVGSAMARAHARNRVEQMRRATMPVPVASTNPDQQCAVDRVRPAAETLYAPVGRWPSGERVTKGDTASVGVSASVKARRDFAGTEPGKGRREAFYRIDLGFKEDEVPEICNHFMDLVDNPPPGLPESLNGKMAVVYVDGNKFGRIRTELQAGGAPPDVALRHFSDHLKSLREDLMRHLVHVMRMRYGPFQHDDKLRMETLLWGGDEARWVVPAWLAWDVIGEFFRFTAPWTIPPLDKTSAPVPLTHAMGVVVCNVKTPIRQAASLSHDLAEAAKAQGRVNACQIEILESLDILPDHLEHHRRALYGDVPAEALSLPGDSWFDITRHVTALKGPGGLPRSQLYRILQVARDVSPEAAVDDLKAVLKEGRYALDGQDMQVDDLLKLPMPGGAINADCMQDQVPDLLPLKLLAQVWDYVDPLDLRQPAPAEV